MAIDPETAPPLLAAVTQQGHHLSAADDRNFEFGLECILDHAGRLLEQNTKPARKATKAPPARKR